MHVSRRREERGAAAVMVAVFTSAILFVLAALVVDLGLARDTRRQAQIAADASALAAGNAMYPDTSGVPHLTAAVLAAQDYAAKNLGITATDWAGCTDDGKLAHVPANSTPCISFNSATRPTQVRVRIPTRVVRTGFAATFGPDTIPVTGIARAAITPGGALVCALCVLSNVAHDIGPLQVSVTGSTIHFNGPSTVAGGTVSTNQYTTLQGTTGSPANFTPAALPNSGRLNDPMAALRLPPDMAGLQPKADPCTGGPGIYGGRSFAGNSTCTLSPGLYVIAGGSTTKWGLVGGSVLNGTGVTLYFTCGTSAAPQPCGSAGQAGAFLDGGGGSAVSITAPTAGDLKGVAIAYDRANTSPLNLGGAGTGGFRGTVYARSSTFYFNGGSGGTSYNSAIVVGDLKSSGTSGQLSLSYDVTQNYQPPASGLRLDQ